MPGRASSFGGGFLQGIADGMAMRRQRQDVAEQRKQQHALAGIKLAMDSGQVSDIADLEPMLAIALPDVFGEQAQKGQKKNEPDRQGMIRNVLSNIFQGGGNQAAMKPAPAASPSPLGPSAGGPTMGDPGQATVNETPTLESRSIGVGAPPQAPAPRRTFMGIPLMSPDEVIDKKVATDIKTTDKTITAQLALARRLFPIMKAEDPSTTWDSVLNRVGLKDTNSTGVPSFSEIAGEVRGPDGKVTPTTGIIDHRTGAIIDPITRQPIPGFIRRTTSASVSLGQYAERAAGELGYTSASAARQAGPEAMQKVNERAAELQAEAAGGVTTARAESSAKAPLSTKDKFDLLMNLQDDWRKADAPVKEMGRQLTMMETGLERFKAGDKNGGSQAIIATFNKLLDPTSVTMVSEYNRTPQGLGLLHRLEGAFEKLKAGGAGVPVEDLEDMVETARQFNQGMATYNDIERERITATAKDAGVSPDRVFGVAKAISDKEDKNKATPGSTGMTMDEKGNIYRDGVLVIPVAP